MTWVDSEYVQAHVGLRLDLTKTYDQLGTITAQFTEEKSGTANTPSYIGVYGSSSYPCVDFYIVEDSFDTMPITPYLGSSKGTAVIDGDTYTFYERYLFGSTTSACSGTIGAPRGGSLYYSVRQSARQCGQISISQHFAEWNKVGMTLGNMGDIMLSVEADGGSGRVDFTSASLTVE